MPSITSANSRSKLRIRREPYWARLAEGAYVGYRRFGDGSWIARIRTADPEAPSDEPGRMKQNYTTLHGIVELDPGEQYDAAKTAAETWFAQFRGGAVRTAKRGSVREALEAYLKDLRRHGREDAAKEAEGRFKSVVWDDAYAELDLDGLTKDDTLEFRERLRKGRLNRSVNRHMTSVIAGLNVAHELGHVSNPAAWTIKRLSDDREDDGDTAVFLDQPQRKNIIDASTQNAAAFFRGLELSGARPKELAKAVVGDFDGDILKLSHRKGRPPKLRTRTVVLGPEGVKFFKAQTKGKLPAAPIFTEDGQTPWRRHVWAREMRAAIEAHNKKAKGKERVPAEASAYSFRHSRISELLQLHQVDPLTVAAQTGTSVAMIEKSYLKFIPSAMRAKLAAVQEA